MKGNKAIGDINKENTNSSKMLKYAICVYNNNTGKMNHYVVATNNIKNVLICKGTDTRCNNENDFIDYIRKVKPSINLNDIDFSITDNILEVFSFLGIEIAYMELPKEETTFGTWLVCSYEHNLYRANIHVIDSTVNILNEALQLTPSSKYKTIEELVNNTIPENKKHHLDESYDTMNIKLYKLLIDYLKSENTDISIVHASTVEYIKYIK